MNDLVVRFEILNMFKKIHWNEVWKAFFSETFVYVDCEYGLRQEKLILNLRWNVGNSL